MRTPATSRVRRGLVTVIALSTAVACSATGTSIEVQRADHVATATVPPDTVPTPTVPPTTVPPTVPPTTVPPTVPPFDGPTEFDPGLSLGRVAGPFGDIDLARSGQLEPSWLTSERRGEATVVRLASNGSGVLAVGSRSDGDGARRATVWGLAFDGTDAATVVGESSAPASQRGSGGPLPSVANDAIDLGADLLVVGAVFDDGGAVPMAWLVSERGDWVATALPDHPDGYTGMPTRVVRNQRGQMAIFGVQEDVGGVMAWTADEEGSWEATLPVDGGADLFHVAVDGSTFVLAVSTHDGVPAGDVAVSSLFVLEPGASGLVVRRAIPIAASGPVVDLDTHRFYAHVLVADPVAGPTLVSSLRMIRDIDRWDADDAWMSTPLGTSSTGGVRGMPLAMDRMADRLVFTLQTPSTEPAGVRIAQVMGDPPPVTDGFEVVDWPGELPVSAFFEREIGAFPSVVVGGRIVVLDSGGATGPSMSSISSSTVTPPTPLDIPPHRTSPYERVTDLEALADGSLLAAVEAQAEVAPGQWTLEGSRLMRLDGDRWRPFDVSGLPGSAGRFVVATALLRAPVVVATDGVTSAVYEVSSVEGSGAARRLGTIDRPVFDVVMTAAGALVALVEAGDGTPDVEVMWSLDGSDWTEVVDPDGRVVTGARAVCTDGVDVMVLADTRAEGVTPVRMAIEVAIDFGASPSVRSVRPLVDAVGEERPVCGLSESAAFVAEPGAVSSVDVYRRNDWSAPPSEGMIGSTQLKALVVVSGAKGEGFFGAGWADDAFASSDATMVVGDANERLVQFVAGGPGLQEARTMTVWSGRPVIGGSDNGRAVVWGAPTG